MKQSGPSIERGGWRFVFPGLEDEGTHDALVELALAAADGRGGQLVRRTLHATTRVVSLIDASGGGRRDVFIKLLNAPRGVAMIKRRLRGSRATHVAELAQELIASAINAPAVLLAGTELSGGREMIAAARAEGHVAARSIGPRRESLARKRAVLHALGTETAKLHRAGFIHGDLTPFNVIVSPGEPIRLVFIDHERTRRAVFHLWRPRLRNLVQLAHFDLPGLTNMDRMRVWRSYQSEIGAPSAIRRRVAAMLARRIARDRGLVIAHPAAAIVDTGKLRES